MFMKFRKSLLFAAVIDAVLILLVLLSYYRNNSIYVPRLLDKSKLADSKGWFVGLIVSLRSNSSDDMKTESPIRARGHPYDSTTIGKLNYDCWRWVPGYTVDDLRLSREFPRLPDERKTVSQLHFEFHEVDKADVRGHYGHKVYGYLLPPTPGQYSFKMQFSQITAAVSGELWISSDSDSKRLTRVLHCTNIIENKYNPGKRVLTEKSVEANNIMLNKTHYFEYLVKAYAGKVIMDVKWKNTSLKSYVDISNSSFALAFKLDSSSNPVDEVLSSPFLRGPLPSNHFQTHHKVFFISNTIYPIKELNILPTCEFKALNLHHIPKESRVKPKSEIWPKNIKGNPTIDKSLVNKVVSLYTAALNSSKEVKGNVMGLHYIEETPNKGDGSRFLLEMDVQLPEETVHTSEYVYLKSGSGILCHTSNFQWTKNAEVYFVVTVRNLGYWVKHLIYNMEDIYEQTKDEHFSLIIVDFGSVDIDIAVEVKRSTFKSIHVIETPGHFSRTLGLQAGIDYVTDPNAIVMAIDLHMSLPPGIVEYTRRHTIRHKMAFVPIVIMLNSGYTEINYSGFWATGGYGLFAMFKDDWTTVEGYNTKKYKYKWGGEDWDIRDRVLNKGYEEFRIRVPGLTHYSHTKRGMWDNKDIKHDTKFTLKYK